MLHNVAAKAGAALGDLEEEDDDNDEEERFEDDLPQNVAGVTTRRTVIDTFF